MAIDDHHVEAVAQATLSLVHGILKLLVKREMMTDSEVKELFLEAARQQRSVYDQHDVHSNGQRTSRKHSRSDYFKAL